jgi:hypothetical protein
VCVCVCACVYVVCSTGSLLARNHSKREECKRDWEVGGGGGGGQTALVTLMHRFNLSSVITSTISMRMCAIQQDFVLRQGNGAAR